MLLISKKDGTFGPVIDLRRVNDATEGEQIPNSVLSDSLMNLGEGNKFFSSLDLLSGYYRQTPLNM